jgi:hypothetical protein
VGNLLSVFHAFHGPGISTALLLGWLQRNRGGIGDSVLHCRKSFAFAAAILTAHSVSLIALANRSSCAKPMFGPTSEAVDVRRCTFRVCFS